LIRVEELPLKVSNLQERWRDRNVRIATIKSAVNGDWAVVDPADDEVEVRSPNLIQVALEDTAESASMVPTIRVGPSGPSREDRDRADKMEKIGWSYLDNSQIELLNIRSLMDLAADGLFCWAVVFDPETKMPLIQWRDPETAYPEAGWKTMDSVRECVFLREVYVTQLPAPYRDAIEEHFRTNSTASFRNTSWQDLQVTLVEHYDEDEILIAALYQQRSNAPVTQQQATYTPIELERFPLPKMPNGSGICPVIIGQRITLDNEPRGQFDQVVNVMLGHIRLMSMVFDYADQAIYSDVYVSDLIGAMPMGGGSYIQLGPNGKIGRVPPAVTEISVFRELEQLIEHVHLGGRWPKVRPGEVDQAIASAKFLEASAGMMNTVIRCMAPETRVLTSDLRYVPVGSLAVGDKLVAFDEFPAEGTANRQWREADVLNVGRAMLDSYRVALTDGTAITCSAEHLWLTGSGSKRTWVRTDELFERHGRYNAPRVVKLLDVWEPLETRQAGYLAGMFDGEGCLSTSGKGLQLGIDQKDNAALRLVKDALTELGFEFGAHMKPNEVWHLNILGGRREILRFLGTIRPQRLIDRFVADGGADTLGKMYGELVDIESVEHVGMSEVVTLATSTETLVAEGFAHHNTYHLIMMRAWAQALRLCFLYDYHYGPERTVSGVLRNQQFRIERSKDDIDLEARVRIDYGTGLGRDVAQSMVLAIQGMQAGIFSREYVQENFDGITDVALERARLDLQQFQDMAMARLLQGLQDGSIPDSALSEIMKARRNGEHVIELFEKYVVKPKEEAQAGMLQSGLTGGAVPPGGDPNAAGGPPVPPPPDLAGMLAGLGGPGGGQPPETIGRLSVPLGQGSFMGTQV